MRRSDFDKPSEKRHPIFVVLAGREVDEPLRQLDSKQAGGRTDDNRVRPGDAVSCHISDIRPAALWHLDRSGTSSLFKQALQVTFEMPEVLLDHARILLRFREDQGALHDRQ